MDEHPTGHDVAAFIKDLQMDATSFPGRAFEVTYEMPEENVGIMTSTGAAPPTNGKRSGVRT